MRNLFRKYAKLLGFSMITGLIFFLIGIIHFFDLPEYNVEYYYNLIERSWYNITYQALFAFGFFFTFLGLFLLLLMLEEKTIISLKKFNLFLILLTLLGGLLITYSLLTPHFILLLDPRDAAFDYFSIGTFLIVFGYTPYVYYGIDNKTLWKYKVLFCLIIIFGLILELLSFITYPSLFSLHSGEEELWRLLFIYGCLILYIGLIPLILSARSESQLFQGHLQLLWLIGGLLGFGVYIAPTLALNGILIPMSIFQKIRYFHFLFFGGLLMITSLLLSIPANNNFQKKLRWIWFILLLIGIFQVIISGILLLSTSYLVDIPIELIANETEYEPTILGMTWDVFFINGSVTSLVTIILLFPILTLKTQAKFLD